MSDELGTTVWFDLPVSDLWDAMSFYEGLLGWKYCQMTESTETDYLLIQAGEKLIGGMRKIVDKRPEPDRFAAPLLYFTVDGLETKVQRAKDLGAVVVGPQVDLGKGRGRYQRLLDREKNLIALWSLR